MTFRRYFGIITTWYLHSHRTWDRLCHSCIGSSFLPRGAFPEVGAYSFDGGMHAGSLEALRVTRPEAVGLERTKPLRGGKDPGLVHKPSASATRPIDSDFAPCLYQRARRAILRHGYAWRQPRFNSSLCGRPALFPERAPCPSIQSTLKQKLCPSRLRPPRLHPQGRRGLSSGRARLRPCGYNILQNTLYVSDGRCGLGRGPSSVLLLAEQLTVQPT